MSSQKVPHYDLKLLDAEIICEIIDLLIVKRFKTNWGVIYLLISLNDRTSHVSPAKMNDVGYHFQPLTHACLLAPAPGPWHSSHASHTPSAPPITNGLFYSWSPRLQ